MYKLYTYWLNCELGREEQQDDAKRNYYGQVMQQLTQEYPRIHGKH